MLLSVSLSLEWHGSRGHLTVFRGQRRISSCLKEIGEFTSFFGKLPNFRINRCGESLEQSVFTRTGTQSSELSGCDEFRNVARVTRECSRRGLLNKSIIAVGLRGAGQTVLLNRSRDGAEAKGAQIVRIEVSEVFGSIWIANTVRCRWVCFEFEANTIEDGFAAEEPILLLIIPAAFQEITEFLPGDFTDLNYGILQVFRICCLKRSIFVDKGNFSGNKDSPGVVS